MLIFMAAWAFSSCGEQGLLSGCGVLGPPCGGSSCGSWTLARWLSHCDAQAWLSHGTQVPPRPGLKPVSPALAGGFLTTGLPGKSLSFILIIGNEFKWMSKPLSAGLQPAAWHTPPCPSYLLLKVQQQAAPHPLELSAGRGRLRGNCQTDTKLLL